MTIRELYAAIVNKETVEITAEMREVAAHALEQMDNADVKAAEKRAEKWWVENAEFVANLKNAMSAEAGMTAADLGAVLGVHQSKVSSAMRKLAAKGEVVIAETKLPKVGTRKVYSLAVEG